MTTTPEQTGAETLEPAAYRRIVGAPPPRASRVVRRDVEDGVPVVIKVAGAVGRDELRREAEVLETLRGPDVVQLLELRDDAESTELVLRDTGGTALSSALAAPSTTAADGIRLLAVACRTVARLHASGWAHGRIHGDHLLLTARGRIRLCSTGAAQPIDADAACAASDRRALIRLVDEWTDARRGRGCRGGLDRVRIARLARATSRLVDDPDPLVLARILERTAGPARQRGGALRGLRTTAAAIAVGALAVGATAVAAIAVGAIDRERDTPPPSSPPPTSTPPTSTVGADGVVVVEGRRYRVGTPGDVMAVGDWDCDGHDTLALLRAGSGRVEVFDTWADGTGAITARTIGRAAGAASIVADPTGCGPPLAISADGRTIALREER